MEKTNYEYGDVLSDPLLTVAEVAAILNMSKGGVYGLTYKGRLPAIHLSPKMLRIRRSDLLSYLLSCEKVPTNA